MSQKVKCPVCNIEYDIRGFPTHYGTKHPVEFAKSIGSQPLKAATDGASLQDSAKLAALSDEVKAKDTQIAQLQDSPTKSDAAFLTVKAELADAISYEHERAIVVDFLDKLTPEGKTALADRLGLATVEDSAELKDTPQPQDELLPNKVPGTTQGGATAARDAHNVEAEGSTPSPATKPEGTAPVADVHPETPGEKWWNDFCQKI